VLSLSQSFPSNADYICNEEDNAIIKSISGYDDERIVVIVDDAFVTFDNFKCLLSPSEYLNGDVSTIYNNNNNSSNNNNNSNNNNSITFYPKRVGVG
jgi:hypothetical protein